MVLGTLLSMGYGFVEFKNKKDALNAIKELQVLFEKSAGKQLQKTCTTVATFRQNVQLMSFESVIFFLFSM